MTGVRVSGGVITCALVGVQLDIGRSRDAGRPVKRRQAISR